MSNRVRLFHPSLQEVDALRCLAYEKLVHIPNGPFLTRVGEGEDAWRRYVRVYKSNRDDAVNYYRCAMTGHHYVEIRGEFSVNIEILIGSAQVAAGLPRAVLMSTIVEAVDEATDAYSKIDFATGLCIGSLTATPEVVQAWTKLLEDEEVRVAVAERLGYRTMPEIAALVADFAARETDPARKPALDQFARIYQTLVEIGPGDAALARFESEQLSPYNRQLLKVGAPGSRFFPPDPM